MYKYIVLLTNLQHTHKPYKSKNHVTLYRIIFLSRKIFLQHI